MTEATTEDKYRNDMATLQVKRVPDELYEAVRARASEEGITISELVLRVLRAEVEQPPLHLWLNELTARHEASGAGRDLDTVAALDEIRGGVTVNSV